MRTKILNINFDTYTRAEALNKLLEFINTDTNHIVVTPNPEMVMVSRKDKEFEKVLLEADLVVPDGIGIVLASKLNKVKITERVAGCDLFLSLFDKIKDTENTVYLLGAGRGVAERAKINMEKQYKGLKIVGVHDGYFDKNEEQKIIEEIQRLKPDVLLVGLGMAKQEKWIYNHKNLNVKISAGVGGSIDVMAGEVKRAPDIFIKFGLEWLYRLLCQPKRIFRMMSLPLFVLVVIKEKILDLFRGRE